MSLGNRYWLVWTNQTNCLKQLQWFVTDCESHWSSSWILCVFVSIDWGITLWLENSQQSTTIRIPRRYRVLNSSLHGGTQRLIEIWFENMQITKTDNLVEPCEPCWSERRIRRGRLTWKSNSQVKWAVLHVDWTRQSNKRVKLFDSCFQGNHCQRFREPEKHFSPFKQLIWTLSSITQADQFSLNRNRALVVVHYV